MVDFAPLTLQSPKAPQSQGAFFISPTRCFAWRDNTLIDLRLIGRLFYKTGAIMVGKWWASGR